MGRRTLALLVVAAAVAGAVPAAAQDAPSSVAPGDDAVVVAVIDGSFSPYHVDFRADGMPQQLDDDPANDLPLDRPAHEWLDGFPDPSTFASFGSLPITLSDDPAANVNTLAAQDEAVWDSFPQSTSDAVHVRWIPGTKAIAAVDFNGAWRANNGAHGNGTSSVSVGDLYGSCPECLWVPVTYGGDDREAALEWAMSQPWIDVITNSYGFSQVERERLYSGSDVEAQRDATVRGQAIFFSSGNGVSNTFTVPNTTYFSSQEGPDWIITVGGVAPGAGNAAYTGSGKPADVAAPGGGYRSAYSSGDQTIDGRGNFGGTSNATPVAAGIYARALWLARQQLDGPSRSQDGGAVAVGSPVACGTAQSECALADGVLTGRELRETFLRSSDPALRQPSPGGFATAPATTAEYSYASAGHGFYLGRLNGDQRWLDEVGRIADALGGDTATPVVADDLRDWLVVDSWCRQQLWGTWGEGYWTEGQPLPGADPAFPLRTAIASSCDRLFPPVAPTPPA